MENDKRQIQALREQTQTHMLTYKCAVAHTTQNETQLTPIWAMATHVYSHSVDANK